MDSHDEVDGALALYQEVEPIHRKLGNENELSTNIGNQAVILMARGRLNDAMALLKEQEGICRRLEKPHGLVLSPVNQAMILKGVERATEALQLMEEAYRLSTTIATTDGNTALVGQIEPILKELRQAAQAG